MCICNCEFVSFSLVFAVALQHAGKHMEDSIVASYTALLLGCLCQGSQVRISDTHIHNVILDYFSYSEIFMSLLSVSPHQINVTTVRQHLPKGDFSIMTEMLKKFLSFMNLTVSMTVRTDVLSSALHDDTATIMIKVTRHVHVVLVDFLPKNISISIIFMQ